MTTTRTPYARALAGSFIREEYERGATWLPDAATPGGYAEALALEDDLAGELEAAAQNRWIEWLRGRHRLTWDLCCDDAHPGYHSLPAHVIMTSRIVRPLTT